jgi:dihydroorotate dehydrogenase
MPDWSYRPLFQPWMLRCPALSHALVASTMRTIGGHRLLYPIIDLLGHMRPSPTLRCEVAGLPFSSPLGLSAVIDRGGRAFHAFERFGYGYVEVGPVAIDGTVEHGRSAVDRKAQALTGPHGSVSLDIVLAELQQQKPRLNVRRLVRIGPGQDERLGVALQALAPHVDGFLVGKGHASGVAKGGKPWGLVLQLSAVPSVADLQGASLIVVDPDDGVWSPADRSRGLAAVAALRKRFPDAAILYAAGGIESAQDAQAFRDAGADLISLSHGFVFTGPGTPKRINEALAVMQTQDVVVAIPAHETLVESARYSWFWCLLLGLAMAAGSILAAFFALTRVLLPYDEAGTGITRAQIEALNPKLLHFMAHDRFTLAGTMLSLGILYAGLAYFGVRRGRSWAQEAVVFSAFGGFLTFFSFLAYGYFDPFHAFVAASMLPIAIQCAVGKPVMMADLPARDMDNDAAWRRACLGQLCWVIEAIGLLMAGTIIMSIGSAHVFVDSDLTFLGATRDSLRMLHPNLVPLIAHDRATFGGMLLASGIGVLLATLWGFHRGEKWLWRTVGLAGFPAYIAALWIHHDIAYTDPLHLSPVFIGLALHLAGWALSAGYLNATKSSARVSTR